MPYLQHSSMVSTSMSLNTSGESDVGSNQASGRSRRASSLPARAQEQLEEVRHALHAVREQVQRLGRVLELHGQGVDVGGLRRHVHGRLDGAGVDVGQHLDEPTPLGEPLLGVVAEAACGRVEVQHGLDAARRVERPRSGCGRGRSCFVRAALATNPVGATRSAASMTSPGSNLTIDVAKSTSAPASRSCSSADGWSTLTPYPERMSTHFS